MPGGTTTRGRREVRSSASLVVRNPLSAVVPRCPLTGRAGATILMQRTTDNLVLPVALGKAVQPTKGLLDGSATGAVERRIGVVRGDLLVEDLQVAVVPLLHRGWLGRCRTVTLTQQRQQFETRHEHRLAVLVQVQPI